METKCCLFHQTGGNVNHSCQQTPPDPAPPPVDTSRIFAAVYETHDMVANLGQRVFALEAAINHMHGQLEEILVLLGRVQPERLAEVSEAIRRSTKERVKQAIKSWLS